MFAGLATVTMSEGEGEEQKIISMSSTEGETLPLIQPFSTFSLKINEWLTELEKQSRLAVCAAVGEAVKDAKVSLAKEDTFIAWMDKHSAQAGFLLSFSFSFSVFLTCIQLLSLCRLFGRKKWKRISNKRQ